MKRWGIKFDALFGDDRRQVQIYTLGWNSFEIMIDRSREGSLTWNIHKWTFHANEKSILTTADFVVLVEMIQAEYPLQLTVRWLDRLLPRVQWTKAPLIETHWALLMYPKWPNARRW